MIDADGLRQIGPQAGSHPGGLFRDNASGLRYYVKRTPTLEHAANEVLAAQLYRAAGVEVPNVSLARWAGGPAVASEYVHFLRPLVPHMPPLHLQAVRRGFAVDCWLANWDVAATENLQQIPGTNAPIRLDTGGALLYRAMGEAKGDQFGERVVEVDTLRDPARNPPAARLFGTMTEADMADDYAATVATVASATVSQLVDRLPFEYRTAKLLRGRLRARRADMAARLRNAERTVPATTAAVAGPVRAWRVWRLGPEPGVLYGPFEGSQPWYDGSLTATCVPPKTAWHGWDSAPHDAPGDRCECGIRGDTDLEALIAYGSPPRATGHHAWNDARDVIGEVELSGRLSPARLDDTPTMLRAAHARVGRRVFFARPLWDHADAFERLHPWSTAVCVETLPSERQTIRRAVVSAA